jgi:hypothetical protein
VQKTIITSIVAFILAVGIFFSGYITGCSIADRSTGKTGTEYSAEISRIAQLTRDTNLARATELNGRQSSIQLRESSLAAETARRDAEYSARSTSLAERERYFSEAAAGAKTDRGYLEQLEQVFSQIRVLAQGKE